MVMRVTGRSLFIAGASLLLVAFLNTEAAACGWCGGQDYNNAFNGTCSRQRWDGYGERKQVTSTEEARRNLAECYADADATVGKITDRPDYFEAEIFDRDQRLIDRVILHKWSGRIRSIQ
jgi:hypothetical protein